MGKLSKAPAPEDPALAQIPTSELLKEAFVEAKELIRVEVALRKRELSAEVAEAKTAGMALGVASAVAILGLAMLLVALVLAIGPTVLTASALGAGLLLVAAITAAVGYARVPRNILPRTRSRVEADVTDLKEHVV